MEKVIYLAGGCFWGVEEYYRRTAGIVDTTVGYANGNTDITSYHDIAKTAHAETVKVVYDTSIIKLSGVLKHFFAMIDPISINRQGADIGTQYRTGIYYMDNDDLPVIKREIELVQNNYRLPIAVEVLPLTNFITAEIYHQRYLDKNPKGYCHIALPPKKQ